MLSKLNLAQLTQTKGLRTHLGKRCLSWFIDTKSGIWNHRALIFPSYELSQHRGMETWPGESERTADRNRFIQYGTCYKVVTIALLAQWFSVNWVLCFFACFAGGLGPKFCAKSHQHVPAVFPLLIIQSLNISSPLNMWLNTTKKDEGTILKHMRQSCCLFLQFFQVNGTSSP